MSVFARMREARPARQRVVWASGPRRPGGRPHQKTGPTCGRPRWCTTNSTVK